MRIPRLYEPDVHQPGQQFHLNDNAFQHAVKALRMQNGQSLELINGRDNGYYAATLLEVSKKQALIEVHSFHPLDNESPLRVHLGQSLSRGERMDYAIQKATELGVATITPLFSERCEVKLNAERQDKRQQHWQQVAISACEQCLRPLIPPVQSPQNLADWCASVEAELKLVLHHRTPARLSSLAKPASVALLIGPEGGLSEAEIELAEQHGFIAMALGPRVLRTETAPVAALSILQHLWGDA